MYVSFSVPMDSMKNLGHISMSCLFEQSDFNVLDFGSVVETVRNKLWKATNVMHQNFTESKRLHGHLCLATPATGADDDLAICLVDSSDSFLSLDSHIIVKFIEKVEKTRHAEYRDFLGQIPEHGTYIKSKLINGYLILDYYDDDRMGYPIGTEYFPGQTDSVTLAMTCLANRSAIMKAVKMNTNGDFYLF